ncbi:MAG: hypothetical protein ABIG71_04310, partial [Candidatus Uhrbacteria bacterium]
KDRESFECVTGQFGGTLSWNDRRFFENVFLVPVCEYNNKRYFSDWKTPAHLQDVEGIRESVKDFLGDTETSSGIQRYLYLSSGFFSQAEPPVMFCGVGRLVGFVQRITLNDPITLDDSFLVGKSGNRPIIVEAGDLPDSELISYEEILQKTAIVDMQSSSSQFPF